MTQPFPRSHRAAILVSFAVLCWAAPSRAQDPAVVQKVADLNKKAVEAYENLDMDEAQKFLQKALELCAAEGMANHRAKARTHFHLGVVQVGGLKQRDKGVQQFKRALEIDPSLTPTKSLLTPEIQSAFEEAKRSLAGGGPVAKEPEPKPEPPRDEAKPDEKPAVSADGRPPRRVKGVFHEPITESKPGSTITVKAAVEAGLAAEKVVLAYRPEGASDFLAREMEKDEQGWWSARIPEPATQGNVVSYYIEARNKAGAALAANGSSAEPHVISLAAATQAGGDATVAKQANDGESPGGGSGGGGGHPKLFFIAAAGGGGGWASGRPELNKTNAMGKQIPSFSGFAPAQLMHFAPEVGLVIAPGVLLSVQGRFQLVTGATEALGPDCDKNFNEKTMLGVCQPATGGVAVLGKVTWLLGDPDASFHPFVSLAAGGGEIRHLVAISSLQDCGRDQETPCMDTILGGRFLLGPAAGVMFDLSKLVSLMGSVNALAGFPYSTVNFDVNVGLGFKL